MNAFDKMEQSRIVAVCSGRFGPEIAEAIRTWLNRVLPPGQEFSLMLMSNSDIEGEVVALHGVAMVYLHMLQGWLRIHPQLDAWELHVLDVPARPVYSD